MRRAIKLCLCFCLLVIFNHAFATKTAIWGTSQGNAKHTGYVPITINTQTLKQQWRQPIDSVDFDALAQPIVGDHHVILYTNDQRKQLGSRILSYGIDKGDLAWTNHVKDRRILFVAYGNDKVLAMTESGQGIYTLDALDKQTGQMQTATELSRLVDFDNSGGLIIDNSVVYATLVGTLEVFAVADNQEQYAWRYQQEWYSPGLGLPPSATDDSILTARADHLIVNKKDNGMITEDLDLDNEYGVILSSPMVIDKEHVYVRAELRRGEYFLYRFNLVNQTSEKVTDIRSNPVSDGRLIYFIRGVHLVALDVKTSALVWQTFMPTDSETLSDLIVTDNVIFVSNSRGTWAMDKSRPGHKLWHIPQHGQLALTDTGLYILEGDRKTQAYLSRFIYTNRTSIGEI